MFISKFQLLIFPNNPNDSVASDRLTDILKNIEFISDLENEGENETESSDTNHFALRFNIGNKFLSNIGFLGCSPDIELEPQIDKPYSYIEISPASDSVNFTSGLNTKITRCPHCKKDLSDLPKRLSENKNQSSEVHCQHCHSPIDPYKLNFRKSAFFARTYIIVGNIYESEAVPDDHFLMTLKNETLFDWRYAYVRFA